MMKLKVSVIIPAHNEEGSIEETLTTLYDTLVKFDIDHEIIVVNDNSSDNTLQVLSRLTRRIPTLVYFTNSGPNGFGYAVRYGLERYTGDCIAIMMADLSDDPMDLVRYYHRMINDEPDCVFGSRFIKGGKTVGYPRVKLVLNRIANNAISILLGIRYNDVTNAFKMYKRETIDGLKPFLSPHFNLTVELPLKAIVRGYSYIIIPNSWHNRKSGESKLKLREMGSRYLFILLYVLIEKYFSRGDFKKKGNRD